MKNPIFSESGKQTQEIGGEPVEDFIPENIQPEEINTQQSIAEDDVAEEICELTDVSKGVSVPICTDDGNDPNNVVPFQFTAGDLLEYNNDNAVEEILAENKTFTMDDPHSMEIIQHQSNVDYNADDEKKIKTRF